ncbi:MAG: CehA/McbA family metallohydrolase [Rhodobacter sp.]|nr:CehA/McbA family metallohydrolase [Rhodobacter sp.]
MTDFFTQPGRFHRGNLHTHSTLSDGALEPAEVCRRYKAEGYDFISLTDHLIGMYDYPIADTTGYRGNGFTTIPGAEIHSGAQQNGELWHILAVGLPMDFAPPLVPAFLAHEDQESGPDLAARARAAGAYVSVAHPHWSGLTLDDARSITAAHSIEAYNHGCAMGCDRPDGFHTLDLLLAEGRRLNLVATDDAHFTEPDHFGGWVMVKATENDPDALLDSLKAGTFYSSQGPELRNIAITERHVEVECSAVASIIVQAHGNRAKAVHGLSMTRGKLPLNLFAASPWIRVSVIDKAGKRAWSNPIWLED